MLLQELVHAVCVGAEVRARVLTKERKLLRGNPREPKRAELLVGVERRLAEDLSEPSRTRPPVQIHLE